MTGLGALIRRNSKLYFKDKGMFFTSLITPMILLVLYAQLILGLSTIVASTHHMDGSVMVMLADWAQAIVTLRPLAAAEAIAPVGLVYKLHVGLGLTLFVLLHTGNIFDANVRDNERARITNFLKNQGYYNF